MQNAHFYHLDQWHGRPHPADLSLDESFAGYANCFPETFAGHARSFQPMRQTSPVETDSSVASSSFFDSNAYGTIPSTATQSPTGCVAMDYGEFEPLPSPAGGSSYGFGTSCVALHEIQPLYDDGGFAAEVPGLGLRSEAGEFKHDSTLLDNLAPEILAVDETGTASPHYDSGYSFSSSDSDSEYTPSHSHKRGRGGAPVNSLARHKVTKRAPRVGKKHKRQNSKLTAAVAVKAGTKNTPMSHGNDYQERVFSCPLGPYGCPAVFPFKNEWKRHFLFQHLCLRFWRCDLCDDHEASPNDFNRKDLFTQHLRRMHVGLKESHSSHKPAKASTASRARMNHQTSPPTPPTTEADDRRLDDARDRCLIPIREPPTEALCVLCDRPFEGKDCHEEWLEHVGKHLLDSARRGADNAKIPWERDSALRAWLIREHLIEPVKAEPGAYAVADASTTASHRESAIQRKEAALKQRQGK